MLKAVQRRRLELVVLAAVALMVAPVLPVSAQYNSAEIAEIQAAQADSPVPASAPAPQRITCTTGVPINFYFSDFETDDGGWAVTSPANYWEHGAVTSGFDQCDSTSYPGPSGAYSGANAWATNLDGCYPNFGADTILSQTFDLSSFPAGTQLELSWWHWYHVFETFDYAVARINGTQVWRTPGSNPSASYEQMAVDISSYAGSTITVEFLLHSTTVVNRPGWYVDDVALTYCGSAEADIHVTKMASGGGFAAPGDTVTYTINVLNETTDADAQGVVVTDTIPTGLTYQSNTCGASYAAPNLTWNIGAVVAATNVSCDVVCTVDPDATGTLVNNVAATASTADPDVTDNAASAPVIIRLAGVPTLGLLGLLLLGVLIAGGAILVIRQRL